MSQANFPNISCALPLQPRQITLAHGGGGRLSQMLLEKVFLPKFTNNILAQRHDSAQLLINSTRLAFTTDAYVVQPLFFPGGDIGKLAVYGTANDLAMSGARPLYLSASFILEEGLAIETLEQIVVSMQQAAIESTVEIVTGDTKVVNAGKGDGVFITTAGIGIQEYPVTIAPTSICAGDYIIVSGDLGRHGIAILAVREGLAFETELTSDCAPLWQPVANLLSNNINVHCLRDLTRGGLASALVELATSSQHNFLLEEQSIVVGEAVQGACAILGLDPIHVANEGRFVAFVPESDVKQCLSILQQHPTTANAHIVGRVLSTSRNPEVILKTTIGIERTIQLPTGEQLPRIC